MQKALQLAQKISKEPDKNWLPDLEEINLHNIFKPIYGLNTTLEDASRIIAFVVFSYDPESQLINIRKDRLENKESIIRYLGLSPSAQLIEEILNNDNNVFNDVSLNYLLELTDWRWQTIFSLLDYHANMIRFVNQKTESEKQTDKMNKEGEVKTLTQDYDIDTLTKVNKQKGELLNQALTARRDADKLLDELKKEFVATDVAVQADFNFAFTDTPKKRVDPLSWREFIISRNNKKKIVS